MKKLVVGLCILAFTAANPVRSADEKEKASPKLATSPGFEALKQLVGEWTAKGPGGNEIKTKFQLTAGGSVVVETIFPGSKEEMVTMYHMDGPDLILTHYCMLGNQPRLKADSAKESKQLSFKSVGGTNMKLEDMHMGQAVITFVDKDHYNADWCACTNGKPDEAHKMSLKFTRTK